MKRFAKLGDFLPTSHVHVKKYCASKGYAIPKHRKTKKPTVNEESLRAMLKYHPTDPVLPLVLEARALNKAAGFLADTYVGRDGKFHPTYTFHPDTGRLASRSPNVMQQPNPSRLKGAKEELAEAVRRTIIPSEGCVLVEADWKNVEAVLTGHFAGDPDYIRLSLLGGHSYLGLHIAGNPPDPGLPDDVLRTIFDKFKKESPAYPRAKQVNLASSYGMGVKHMSEVLGVSITEARRLMRIKEDMAPRVKQWIRDTRLRAHKERMLVNPFGYVSPYFFDVLRKKDNGEMGLGDQANQVLAFLPQSTGASMLRECILLFDTAIDWEECRLLIPIHDSFLFEVREDRVEWWLPIIRDIMTREWPELGGRRMGVDIKQGVSWGEMV